MKFDPKKPHGIVVGHDFAKFEQNGILYDGAGLPIDPAVPDAVTPAPAGIPLGDLQVMNASEFLRGLLKNGPLDKSVVFKEAENNNQRWDTVKTAFASMKGRETKRAGTPFWALPTE